MTDDTAFGILATGTRTRIAALALHAREIVGTLSIRDAFGPTRWRCSDKARQTCAGRRLTDCSALGIRTARRWLTRLDGIALRRRLDDGRAAVERIARLACGTPTEWHVIHDRTCGTDAARANARITALLIQTGEILSALIVQHALGPALRRHANEAGHA